MKLKLLFLLTFITLYLQIKPSDNGIKKESSVTTTGSAEVNNITKLHQYPSIHSAKKNKQDVQSTDAKPKLDVRKVKAYSAYTAAALLGLTGLGLIYVGLSKIKSADYVYDINRNGENAPTRIRGWNEYFRYLLESVFYPVALGVGSFGAARLTSLYANKQLEVNDK